MFITIHSAFNFFCLPFFYFFILFTIALTVFFSVFFLIYFKDNFSVWMTNHTNLSCIMIHLPTRALSNAQSFCLKILYNNIYSKKSAFQPNNWHKPKTRHVVSLMFLLHKCMRSKIFE